LDEFLARAGAKHGTKYDYSKVRYIDARTKVEITCPRHGPFRQAPTNHLSGQGCRTCGIELQARNQSLTQEEFVTRAGAKHGSRYDYSLVQYKNWNEKIKIICPDHGVFPQAPGDHLSGRGCPDCGKAQIAKKKRKGAEHWLNKFHAAHGDRYDYSLAKITTGRKKIQIICRVHGPFPQRPENHAMGQGCPSCGDESSAEKQRMSHDEWLERAMECHGDRYDYSRVKYKGWDQKVEIICPIHGVFRQRAGHHLKGNNCDECARQWAGEAKRWSTEQWIERAKEVHGDKYDYSFVDYQGSWEEVEIICPLHGLFRQKAAVHTTMGMGCRKCGREKQALSQTYTQDDFLRLAHAVHGDLYDYSQAVYKPRVGGVQETMTIICRKHGPFPQRAHDHLNGKGCPTCKHERLKTVHLLAQDEFTERARSVHGDYYDYSLVEYRGIKNFVKIICPKHGPFPQRAEGHLDGNGCPKCSTSTGEKAVSEILEAYGIRFEIEKRFDGCRRVHRLPFDFYLPDRGALIEYDGAQHFVLAGWFDSDERAREGLELIQKRDGIKTAWARAEGFPLHRIRYDEDVKERMEQILSDLGLID
jgi:hypothetical protein